MAKPKPVETPIMKAAIAAKDAYTKAKEALEIATKAHEAKPSKATEEALNVRKEAVQTASKTMTEAVKASNKETFVRIGKARLVKALEAIESLAKLANPKAYTFDETQVSNLTKQLQGSVDTVQASFKTALNGNSGAKSRREVVL